MDNTFIRLENDIFTRRSWVSGIMDRLDVNQDSRIAWDEFVQAVKTG